MKLRRLRVIIAIFISLAATGIGFGQDTDGSAEEETWWNDRVFYEVFVRSFYDSDGDGIGDLQGLIQKLDYLNDGDPSTTEDLGVTGLWLMPIMASPSYHGYDVTDYYTVNPDYGTNDDFKQLMAEAHQRGIAVIVDLVLNHTSSQNPWFLESQTPGSEYDDWYVWEAENPNFKGPDGQTVWYKKGDRYYYALFWSEMPDLNYQTPEVNERMYDASRFWLEEMGADGFRLDAIKYIVEEGTALENTASTHEWLSDYHDYVKSVNPRALLVGEAWTSSNLIVPYVTDEVDVAFEFDLAGSLVRASSFGLPNTARTAIETTLATFPEGQYATFLTNHDQNRLMTQLRGNIGAAKVASAILLTLPGVPFIYYGEEIGMTGQKPDELIRTPMQWDDTPTSAGFTTGTPWQKINADSTGVNVNNQETSADSLLNHYRALVQARSASHALQHGSVTFVESASRKVLSYLRTSEEQTVLVVVNMDDQPVSDYALALPENYRFETASLLVGEGEVAAPTVGEGYIPVSELAPQSVIVIELGL